MAAGEALAALKARWPRLAPMVALAALAGLLAWGFAFEVSRHTPSMGLPLDDSYIYLTYAKQFGRGQPFTYYPGGGYSAGSTSVLWPVLLAPFWTIGLRGHALVWVSFLMCAALFAAVASGCYRAGREVGGPVAGGAAAVLTLAIAPFAFTSLSGMEVAFASALLVLTILRLRRQARDAGPGWTLGLCLAATSLSRPELTLLVGAICGIATVDRLRQRRWRPAVAFAAPLLAPLAWVCANKVFAGNFFPNTGVAKSHFYLPGFDWTYWTRTVGMLNGQMFKGLWWDAASPLVWPKVMAALWLVGAVRIGLWARRERAYLVGALIALAPLLMIEAVIASSGLWDFQHYRYIAPAFPLIMITVGCALAPPAIVQGWARRGWAAAVVVAIGLFANAAWPALREDMRLFAQGAVDTNTQVVAIGQYLHAKRPHDRVMFHDAGAIAYYGDGEVYDMLGLVTNFQAGVANNGGGSRFEFLESLPPERRPTLFAYYPGWMGQAEFFGEDLMHTPISGQFAAHRLVGDGDMQVLVARWDHVGTGERPLTAHDGWAVVDRLDVADLASEQAHGYVGALGRRVFRDPTARWSFVHKDVGPDGLVLDGGRTIRGARERFTVSIDPARPLKLILRSGGNPAYPPYQDELRGPVTLTVRGQGGGVLATATVPAPQGTFREVELVIDPARLASCVEGGVLGVEVEGSGPYRSFHWFALQPA